MFFNSIKFLTIFSYFFNYYQQYVYDIYNFYKHHITFVSNYFFFFTLNNINIDLININTINEDYFFKKKIYIDKNNNNTSVETSDYILKLIAICTKKGKKNKAYALVKKAFQYIVTFFYFDLILLLLSAIHKIQNFLRIRLIRLRSRQHIISNFLLTEQQRNIALRTINNNALQIKNNYYFFHEALSESIIYYSFLDILSENVEDPLLLTMYENNELVSLNKHFFYRKIRYRNRRITGRRRFKLIHLYKKKENYYEK